MIGAQAWRLRSTPSLEEQAVQSSSFYLRSIFFHPYFSPVLLVLPRSQV
jgi:hypothetical protein